MVQRRAIKKHLLVACKRTCKVPVNPTLKMGIKLYIYLDIWRYDSYTGRSELMRGTQNRKFDTCGKRAAKWCWTHSIRDCEVHL